LRRICPAILTAAYRFDFTGVAHQPPEDGSKLQQAMPLHCRAKAAPFLGTGAYATVVGLWIEMPFLPLPSNSKRV
jgi:hypothetical protein